MVSTIRVTGKPRVVKTGNGKDSYQQVLKFVAAPNKRIMMADHQLSDFHHSHDVLDERRFEARLWCQGSVQETGTQRRRLACLPGGGKLGTRGRANRLRRMDSIRATGATICQSGLRRPGGRWS